MRFILLAAVVFSLISFSCALNKDPNRNSGEDGYRHQAKGVKAKLKEQGGVEFELFLDSVDYDIGDASDWRYVDIPMRGILTMVCGFDNINAKTVINIKDATGRTLATQRHEGEPKQEATAKVDLGRYYLEVTATEEGSKTQYTCQPSFDAVVWDKDY